MTDKFKPWDLVRFKIEGGSLARVIVRDPDGKYCVVTIPGNHYVLAGEDEIELKRERGG